MVVGSGENVILLNPLSVLAPKKKQDKRPASFLPAREFVQHPPGYSDERGSLGLTMSRLLRRKQGRGELRSGRKSPRRSHGSDPKDFSGTARRLADGVRPQDNPEVAGISPTPSIISSIRNEFELWIRFFITIHCF